MVRSNRTAIAAILVFVYSLQAVIRLFVEFVNQSEFLEEAGLGFATMALILASISLVSSYGIWQNQRWGKITAIVILTLNALFALPGILFAPTFVERLEPLMGVLVAIVVVVLLLWPTPQSSTA